MLRRLFLCGAAVCLLAAGPSAFNEKTVLVSVVANDAGPMKDLKPADFSVLEDKDKLEVTGADRSTDPLSVVLLIDGSQQLGAVQPTQELRRAVSTFLTTLRAADPSSEIAIYEVENAPMPLTDFTASQADFDKAIARLVPGAQMASVMLEGVVTAAKRLSDRPAPRRAIVAISFGTAEGGTLQPKKVADEVQKSGATLWAVSVEASTDPTATTREAVWTQVTTLNGGTRQTTVSATALESPLKAVANSLTSQYTLTLARKGDGAVKMLKGQARGSQVLFTHWMR